MSTMFNPLGHVRFFFLMMAGLAIAARGQAVELLWPAGAPGALDTTQASKPSLTIFPAPADKAAGTAMIICPGGAYTHLATDKEGYQIAKWFNAQGVTGFVLQYRLGPAYHHPIEMHDAQRAIRWVRANAKRFNLNVNRIGIVGFSAGGHLASTAATHYDNGNLAAPDTVDRFGCRPDFQVLGYPVITMDATFTNAATRLYLLGNNPSQKLVDSLSNEKQVTADTPPAFIFATKDDNTAPVANSQAYYDACVKAGVKATLKLYDTGPHGFGLADGQAGAPNLPVLATWPTLVTEWLRSGGFLPATSSLARKGGEPAWRRGGAASASPSIPSGPRFDLLGRTFLIGEAKLIDDAEPIGGRIGYIWRAR